VPLFNASVELVFSGLGLWAMAGARIQREIAAISRKAPENHGERVRRTIYKPAERSRQNVSKIVPHQSIPLEVVHSYL
jgi:hypothetical protein